MLNRVSFIGMMAADDSWKALFVRRNIIAMFKCFELDFLLCLNGRSVIHFVLCSCRVIVFKTS